jgi:hypothetical protein
MIASGATIKRYDGTRECAISMILDMVKHKPVIIKLQQEIAAGKRLIETDVGAFIYEEITKMQEKHKQELQHLREEIEEAMERSTITNLLLLIRTNIRLSQTTKILNKY